MEERAIVRDGLNDWNITRGRRAGVMLLPWLWERHAVPQIGGRPQSLINSQAVDQSDVVVAFFDSRLGTSTGVDVSGTAEEINRAADAGKPVHVYFSSEDLSRGVDLEQLRALQDFKKDLEGRGLLGSYTDPNDLAGQVVRAIEADIESHAWDSTGIILSKDLTASLTWEHRVTQRLKGPGRDKSGAALIVKNQGALAAEDLQFTVEPVGNTAFVFPNPPAQPELVRPKSELSWPLLSTRHMGAEGRTIAIHATWREGDAVKRESQTITLND